MDPSKETILQYLDSFFEESTFSQCEFKLQDPEGCGMMFPTFSRINKNTKIMRKHIDPERYERYRLTPLYIKMDEYIFYSHINPIMKYLKPEEWKFFVKMKEYWESIDQEFNKLINQLEKISTL